MTLRLKRHDEIIDAMAEALLANRNRSSTKKATAALDALLEAAVKLGVGRNAVCVEQELRTSETGWMAASYWTEYEEGVPALILQLEENSHETA